MATGQGMYGEPAEDQPAKPRRLRSPAGCLKHLRTELAREFEQITAGFIEAAKTGSVPHVKLATELLTPAKQPTRKKSTAARILKEWAEKKKRQTVDSNE